ncbi:MAG: hypothetical protein K9L68_11650, partial [Spirochaetales bacterium]|nr:hypothetical protein [Spirochaetales bacterium]
STSSHTLSIMLRRLFLAFEYSIAFTVFSLTGYCQLKNSVSCGACPERENKDLARYLYFP